MIFYIHNQLRITDTQGMISNILKMHKTQLSIFVTI